MKKTDTSKHKEMARAEHTASANFYAGVKRAEQDAVVERQGKRGADQNLHEIVNVLEGRWMH